ncbi:acetate--CoA ligase family protein [Cupriavidus sp. AU9028]|uniref:acetate--CoA ligase family protein n=1 Tax=Cupriavidus sp. AU9028 TaxID=2871157 RepID=UPI001C985485|nr:acetate--CoA ligase family protein [Cupriavidus sp. AU9028]MBY4898477.1 acetate--CoA ligase family protein [Cupriavidus sp. AU9028]
MTAGTTDLSRLIHPRSIALVGASDRATSIGERTMTNLLAHSRFDGDIWLVNPGKTELAGRRCWPSVAALPATPDVAVVVVPAAGVLEVLEQCGARGVRFAIVLSSGFGETGPDGERAQQQMQAIAARTGMRLYGPNCPGLTNVNAQLGLTFSPSFPHDLVQGPIGLATQGGGLGRNVMQAMERGIGIGLWASTGNEVDLQVADFIGYMADAPDIKVIATLLEGIKDGARFVAAVQRAAANGKPVVALKVGRSEYGRRAAQSHTASLTGSAEVNSAVFRQLGVIEVHDIDELVDTAWLLARALPQGRDALAVYCSSGGTSALTADAVGAEGLTLASFATATTETLRASLPDYAAIGNPVDTTAVVLSDATVVEKTLGAVAADPNVGLVVLPITLDYGETTTRMAQNIVNAQARTATPILPIWMSDRLGDGYRVLVEHGFAPPRTVNKAITAVRRWVEYGRWRARQGRAPSGAPAPRLPTVPSEPRQIAGSGDTAAVTRRALTEAEAKHRLRQHGIALLPFEVARSAEEAVRIATGFGYPVVAKIASADILHKSDIGGVRIGLADAAAVHEAFESIGAAARAHCPDARIDGVLIEKMAPAGGIELMVGVTRDPVFGHVMTFGLGGIHVEILRDVSRRMLPLQAGEAAALVREIRAFPLLAGARGRPPADLSGLEALLMQVSRFVADNAGWIEEMDLNPVWVDTVAGGQSRGAMPLDAVIVERRPDGTATGAGA